MPDPLIELALRVQLSGVPPAYGSWLLTPRPPLHEGEKQPIGRNAEKFSELIPQCEQIPRLLTSLNHSNLEPAGNSQNTTLQSLLGLFKGRCVGEGVYFVLSRLNAFHFSFSAR